MSAPNPQVGLEVTTRRTITATTESPDGMTLDELAGLLRRAMAAGMDPTHPAAGAHTAQRWGAVRQRRGGRDGRLTGAATLATRTSHAPAVSGRPGLFRVRARRGAPVEGFSCPVG